MIAEILTRPDTLLETPVQERRYIVEIGPGHDPFTMFGRKMLPHETYVGIDPEYGRTSSATETVQHQLKSDPAQLGVIELYAADGTAIVILNSEGEVAPFPDMRADEVVMVNVLGDSLLEEKRERLLIEADRILAPNGVLTIVENYTPGVTPLSYLVQVMGGLGLVQINQGDERNLDEILKYNPWGLNNNSQSYIAEFSHQVI